MRLARFVFLSVALAALACSKSKEEPQIQAPAPAPMEMAQVPMTEPVVLDEAEVKRFIQAGSELRRLGVETKLEGGDVSNLAEGFAANREAMSILESNGFTVDRFQRVLYSVGMAFAALETRDKQAEIESSRAQQEKMLDQMKGSLSPEQYEGMKKQMEGATTMLDQMQNQPQANVDLVAKHRTEIEAAFSGK